MFHRALSPRAWIRVSLGIQVVGLVVDAVCHGGLHPEFEETVKGGDAASFLDHLSPRRGGREF